MRYITLREACREMDIPFSTAFFHLKRGRIKGRKLGRLWVITLDEMEIVRQLFEAGGARALAARDYADFQF